MATEAPKIDLTMEDTSPELMPALIKRLVEVTWIYWPGILIILLYWNVWQFREILAPITAGIYTLFLTYEFYRRMIIKSEEPEVRVPEVVARRNKPAAKFFRFVKKNWIWITIVSVSIGVYLDPVFAQVIFGLLSFLVRIVGAIGFVLVQFIAIFWFMAKTKVEQIVPEDTKSLTFADYKGQPRLLELVSQWISLLQDRMKFRDMGGEYINGLLLYGKPGTGKTMLAKCMAGESDIAFLSIEGSGFRAMFMGVDVLKMIAFIRKAKKLAREYGACIAFIDEIDAVGASRGNVMGGEGSGIRRHVNPMMGGMGGGGGGSGALTRLLYEMDGVEDKTRSEKFMDKVYEFAGLAPPDRNWHVLFMGSTNRPDVLDPALTRPGRFDRSIEVSPPDRSGRRDIISYYINRIRTDDSIDLEAIIADTNGYTPAQIMSAITKDAVRMAVFDGRESISQRDIDLAFQEQAMGLENPIEELPEKQKEQIAYHEAGHAIAIYYLVPEQKIVRATIIRRSNALGYVLSSQTEELHALPLTWYVRHTMVSLGGDVSTKIWSGGEPWTGTSGDFQSVRSMINALAAQGYFGPPVHEPQQMAAAWRVEDQHSKYTRFWKKAESATEQMLKDHWEEVEAVAQALLDKGDLSGKEVVQIIQDVTGITTRPGEKDRIDDLIEKGNEGITVSGNGKGSGEIAVEAHTDEKTAATDEEDKKDSD